MTASTQPPPLAGLYCIRIPVRDVWASRDFYVEVLGCEAVLDAEDESSVTGVVVYHPSGVTIGLHLDPARAKVMSGFAPLTLRTWNRGDLEEWSDWLDSVGAAHRDLAYGEPGWFLDVLDPDGIVIRLHSSEEPSLEEA
jgi:catechol 2,3-dioxygenase-like lactoylglutathione lyase family enzyme